MRGRSDNVLAKGLLGRRSPGITSLQSNIWRSNAKPSTRANTSQAKCSPRASLAHNRLASSTILEIGRQLGEGPCEIFGSGMRVAVPDTGLYTYPDASVCCGGPKLLDGHMDTLLNPTLIVEVLSRSTEAYDQGKKFKHYRTIPTLREYVLIGSESIGVELRTLQSDGDWLLKFADHLEDVVELQSISAAGWCRRIFIGGWNSTKPDLLRLAIGGSSPGTARAHH